MGGFPFTTESTSPKCSTYLTRVVTSTGDRGSDAMDGFRENRVDLGIA